VTWQLREFSRTIQPLIRDIREKFYKIDYLFIDLNARDQTRIAISLFLDELGNFWGDTPPALARLPWPRAVA